MVDDSKPDSSDDLNHPESSPESESGASTEGGSPGASESESLVTPAEKAAADGSPSDDTPSADAAQEHDPDRDEDHDPDHDDAYHDDHYHDDHYHDDHYNQHDPHHDDAPTDPNAMTFLEHLEELRKTILRCLAALGIGLAIALPLTNKILSLLYRPLRMNGHDANGNGILEMDERYDPDAILNILEMTGSVKVILTVGFWGGILLSAPFMIFAICRFIFPGLKERERKVIVGTSGFAVALFALGVAMCYFFTLPFAVKIMFGFAKWIGAGFDVIRLNDYISFCLKLMLGFGLAFELPEVLFVLGYLGLVNSTQLRQKRRHVMVGLLFLAMMLTPPDPMTQMMLAIPLYVLFEITIWLIWAKEKRDIRKEARA
jgi:sec-independent protein translocase protein TatC